MIEFHDNIVRFGFDKPAFVRSLISERYRFTLFLCTYLCTSSLSTKWSLYKEYYFCEKLFV